MSARAVLLACLGALLLAGCGSASLKRPVDTAKIVDAIKTDEVHWNADYKSGDAARLAAHFAPDAVVMAAGSPPLVGTAAIQSATSHLIGQPGFRFAFASDRVDVAASGDLAATHGSYRMTTEDPRTGAPVTEAGSYVTVYKPLTSGVWKAVWDITAPGALAAGVGSAP
jgi:ketosteroid isomerase-like protein